MTPDSVGVGAESAVNVPPLPPIRASRAQVLLFVGTVLSTLTMYPLVQGVNPLTDHGMLVDTLTFSATLLTILGLHELAHFVVGRYYRVDVSLPYFIPAPNLLGTFGAVIRIRSAITHRPALLMIGAAGPIAGFLAAIPVLAIGIALSEVGPIDSDAGIVVGAPPIFIWLLDLVHGPLGEGEVLELSGMAFAGWAGLFLTAFNLLPLGQLDGGHVLYALLGRHTALVSLPILALLLVAGVMFWLGWLIMGVLILVVRLAHPPVSDPTVPLRPVHWIVAGLCLVIFLVCFTLVPIVVV